MTAFAPSWPAVLPIHPVVQRAIGCLLGHGRDLIGRMVAARIYANYAHVPRRFRRDPVRAEQRLNRALDWVFALTRTLAGDSFYLRRYGPTRPPTAAPAAPRATARPPRPRKPATQAQRDLAQLRAIRIAFETIPIARLARRLARRLGVRENYDGWPTQLLKITETPAEYCARINRPAPQAAPDPEPRAQPPDPPSAPLIARANPPSRAGP